MSEYVIITDTSADIPASVLDKGQIHLIPMVYQLNGEEHPHKDPGSWDSKAFYDQLRNGGIGSTSQISPAVYTDYFEPFLKEARISSIFPFPAVLLPPGRVPIWQPQT